MSWCVVISTRQWESKVCVCVCVQRKKQEDVCWNLDDKVESLLLRETLRVWQSFSGWKPCASCCYPLSLCRTLKISYLHATTNKIRALNVCSLFSAGKNLLKTPTWFVWQSIFFLFLFCTVTGDEFGLLLQTRKKRQNWVITSDEKGELATEEQKLKHTTCIFNELLHLMGKLLEVQG